MNYLLKNLYRKGDKIKFSDKKELKITETFDNLVNFDGYTVKIGSDKEIEIKFSNERGKLFGEIYAEELLNRAKGVLPVCIAEDYPDIKIRGVIEGFYGKPYSFETRKNLIDTIISYKMNSYFYAPKDDVYHRDKWRELYPETEAEKLKEFIGYCNLKLVDFYFCISPGKDFRYSDEAEYVKLENKLQQVMNWGVKGFAVLFDDIKLELCEADAEKFGSCGKAQAYVLKRAREFIGEKFEFIMCPTEYIQPSDSPYKKDLRENMPQNIKVFWTGYNTVAEFITESDAKKAGEVFGRELILWDNYPVNDFSPKRRIYLGAIENRTADLNKTHSGMVSNPMPSWELSKIAVSSMADFMWNSHAYNKRESLIKVCKSIFGNDYKDALNFFGLNSLSIFKPRGDKEAELFKIGDFIKLEKFYNDKMKSIEKLSDLKNPFVNELRPYLNYFKNEYTVFKQLTAGKIDGKLCIELSLCPVGLQNQELLKYIKEHRLIPEYNEIKIDSEREEYTKL